jgi:hypothetical protein
MKTPLISSLTLDLIDYFVCVCVCEFDVYICWDLLLNILQLIYLAVMLAMLC